MNDHDHFINQLKHVGNLLAALLGIGTFAGLVNVMVGVLSASWLMYQLWVSIRYELPIKRARLEAIRQGLKDPSETDRGGL